MLLLSVLLVHLCKSTVGRNRKHVVDVAVDIGLEIPVEVLDNIGGGLLAGLRFGDLREGVGEGLLDEVDIDKDRRAAPYASDGEGSGEPANEALF